MRKFTIRDLTLAALIAAVYAAVTMLLPAYGEIQLRVSEAMTVLPFLFPAATPGLVACILTQHMPSRWLAPLPPVLCNALIVGAEIAWYATGFGPGFWTAYALNIVTVGLAELIACAVLGELLLSALPNVPVLRPYIPEHRLALM